MSKKCVYVAGKLSDPNSCNYIKNVHTMIKEAKKIRDAGFSVYVPCVDLLEGIVSGDFDYDDYFNNSQTWLEKADAVYVCFGWEKSTGTKREIALAMSKDIPVWFTVNDLIEWNKNNGQE